MELFRSYAYAKNTYMRLRDFFIDYLKGKKPVFMCLGTDKLVGDCLAPLVAEKLRNKKLPFYIYGGLDSPITAQNAVFAYEFIRLMHPTSTLILLDSMTTPTQSHLGDIVLTDKHFSAINKVKISPDLCVYGVTSLFYNNLLDSARLKNVVKIADILACALFDAIEFLEKNRIIIDKICLNQK